MPRFLELVTAHQPVGLVVGLPLGLDGREGTSSTAVRELAALATARTGLPVAFQDERLTSVQVQEAIREMGGSARGRREEVDALAAVVVLQAWLEERRGRTGAFP